MVMLLLVIVRDDLLAGWRARLPPDAPNRFLINIQPHERDAIKAWFVAEGLPAPRLYPMVRGRLTHINGNPVDLDRYTEPRARSLADREFNLSWTDTLQTDNRVIDGRFWSPDDRTPQFSFERDIMTSLDLKLGDALTFRIADQDIQAPITSVRHVDWDSFNVNFFTVSPPGMLDDYPATWITAFRLDDNSAQRMVRLVRAFPSVTVIDIEALERQVRSIMDRAAAAVEYVFGFTLLAGIIVLYAGIAITQDARMREVAVLRALGAADRTLRTSIGAETAVLGAVCGLTGAIGALLAGALLAGQVFDFPITLNPWLLPAGLLAGVVGVGAFVWLGLRRILRATAIATLRRT
ncbi:MAG: ABC transporter permease [Gammaproteobacteria bacterium]